MCSIRKQLIKQDGNRQKLFRVHRTSYWEVIIFFSGEVLLCKAGEIALRLRTLDAFAEDLNLFPFPTRWLIPMYNSSSRALDALSGLMGTKHADGAQTYRQNIHKH